MATLTVRNIESEVLDELKALAKTHDRSLEAEVRAILRREARGQDSRRPTVEELLALADGVAALTPGVPQTDSTDILRELRDGRR